MMTSSQIRQSFLDFFKSKQHSIVSSSSLMPDSPNLLFTNAGMNQFVPIFLGQARCPYTPGRAADTQKCIRAGGKHNDLEDVGLDTYHHTFFEMLGNWSFGDYFKREAIEWAWELVTEVWKFPKHRIYATVYAPDKSRNDPAEFDDEAAAHWTRLFTAAGLDPKVHICHGNKKDNFWMMGDTGPCGPCSELHVNLLPDAEFDEVKGRDWVNAGSPKCIEIWNLVFMQFNANPDGTYSPLPARSVDTGMGFERVASLMQCTRDFTDFSARISNYETDVFRPIFDRLERMSGLRYGSTLPLPGATALSPEEKVDIAFRVIADHIRTLSFAIADGIQPGNTDRNYVLRRILRRAVRYGRTLGFQKPFFFELVEVLAETMGDIFPEIRAKRDHVRHVIQTEEVAFNKTLDRGIDLFNQETASLKDGDALSGAFAFKLYDTYGFPLDLTGLMARERGLAVDETAFNALMEEQRVRARKAQKKEVIELSQIETQTPTAFVGYDSFQGTATVLEVLGIKDKTAVILDASPFYAEMGGQVGDSGELSQGSRIWRVTHTQKSGATWLHFVEGADAPDAGAQVTVSVDTSRRAAIQRHHTATHLLHWALRQVTGDQTSQKGSFVGPDKLTFDFNGAPLTPAQLAEIERLVNERVVENAPVAWREVPYDAVRERKDVMQFFGDKYGDSVRVVSVGACEAGLGGYSMELCGGTHCRATGEIGLFRIVSENAIAAGVRRIEAVAGMEAFQRSQADTTLIKNLAGIVSTPVIELEKKLEAMLEQQRQLEKTLRAFQQKQAAENARAMLAQTKTINGIPALIERVDADGDTLQSMVNELKGLFKGVVVLAGAANNAVALVASVSSEFTARVQAGKIIQQIAPVVGGKGGGKPDNARGGGKDTAKVDEALAKAASLI